MPFYKSTRIMVLIVLKYLRGELVRTQLAGDDAVGLAELRQRPAADPLLRAGRADRRFAAHSRLHDGDAAIVARLLSRLSSGRAVLLRRCLRGRLSWLRRRWLSGCCSLLLLLGGQCHERVGRLRLLLRPGHRHLATVPVCLYRFVERKVREQ